MLVLNASRNMQPTYKVYSACVFFFLRSWPITLEIIACNFKWCVTRPWILYVETFHRWLIIVKYDLLAVWLPYWKYLWAPRCKKIRKVILKEAMSTRGLAYSVLTDKAITHTNYGSHAVTIIAPPLLELSMNFCVQALVTGDSSNWLLATRFQKTREKEPLCESFNRYIVHILVKFIFAHIKTTKT